MTATASAKPWDFSQVLELANSLHGEYVHSGTKNIGSHVDGINDDTAASLSQGLGDFSRIFHYLGTPVHEETPDFAVKTPAIDDAINLAGVMREEYMSDGATYSGLNKSSSKAVRFNEQTSNEEGVTTDAVSDSSLPPDTPTLTEKQRKKKNQKDRKAREAALKEANRARRESARLAKASISESEAEIAKATPARKASAHTITTTPQNRYSLRQRDSSGKAITSIPDENFDDAVANAIRQVQSAKKASPTAATPAANQQPNTDSNTTVLNSNGPISNATNGSNQRGNLSNPSLGSAKLFPATVQPPANSAAKRSSTQQQATPTRITNTTKSANSKFAIKPMITRSGEDRHWALLMKLIRDFPEDRRHLIAPMNLTTHNNDPKGIHVFVDASNIFIGFTQQLKLARGIHPLQPVPTVDLSFDALALLIERRRPVAKRVLVGSTPRLPAFDKAKAVGYECSILEKVYKARELSERSVYFRELDRARGRAKAPPANKVATLNGGGTGSGSETSAPQYDRPRMIEQGVDEILHLKILESIVDSDEPGTVVLATGDAAQAEYSEGFMRMAERALTKGWIVELVSWSKNISQLYTKQAWTNAWGTRFRIVYLDDYAEELLDM